MARQLFIAPLSATSARRYAYWSGWYSDMEAGARFLAFSMYPIKGARVRCFHCDRRGVPCNPDMATRVGLEVLTDDSTEISASVSPAAVRVVDPPGTLPSEDTRDHVLIASWPGCGAQLFAYRDGDHWRLYLQQWHKRFRVLGDRFESPASARVFTAEKLDGLNVREIDNWVRCSPLFYTSTQEADRTQEPWCMVDFIDRSQKGTEYAQS